MTVGIIGYGRFGQLAARYCARTVNVTVFDPSWPQAGRRPHGVVSASLEEAARQRIVLLCVPVSALQRVLRQITTCVRPGSLIIDVCAVKGRPARWMKDLLPTSVSILGTHPLFGPDTAARTLRGKTVILCPVRISRSRLLSVRRFLHRKGMTSVVMSAGEHDRLAAETVLLTQVLGRMLVRAGIRRRPPVTATYGALLSMMDIAERDSRQLFLDMASYNPYGKRTIRRLLAALRSETGDVVSRHEK